MEIEKETVIKQEEEMKEKATLINEIFSKKGENDFVIDIKKEEKNGISRFFESSNWNGPFSNDDDFEYSPIFQDLLSISNETKKEMHQAESAENMFGFAESGAETDVDEVSYVSNAEKKEKEKENAPIPSLFDENHESGDSDSDSTDSDAEQEDLSYLFEQTTKRAKEFKFSDFNAHNSVFSSSKEPEFEEFEQEFVQQQRFEKLEEDESDIEFEIPFLPENEELLKCFDVVIFEPNYSDIYSDSNQNGEISLELEYLNECLNVPTPVDENETSVADKEKLQKEKEKDKEKQKTSSSKLLSKKKSTPEEKEKEKDKNLKEKETDKDKNPEKTKKLKKRSHIQQNSSKPTNLSAPDAEPVTKKRKLSANSSADAASTTNTSIPNKQQQPQKDSSNKKQKSDKFGNKEKQSVASQLLAAGSSERKETITLAPNFPLSPNASTISAQNQQKSAANEVISTGTNKKKSKVPNITQIYNSFSMFLNSPLLKEKKLPQALETSLIPPTIPNPVELLPQQTKKPAPAAAIQTDDQSAVVQDFGDTTSTTSNSSKTDKENDKEKAKKKKLKEEGGGVKWKALEENLLLKIVFNVMEPKIQIEISETEPQEEVGAPKKQNQSENWRDLDKIAKDFAKRHSCPEEFAELYPHRVRHPCDTINWELIAETINASSGLHRTAEQCERRFLFMNNKNQLFESQKKKSLNDVSNEIRKTSFPKLVSAFFNKKSTMSSYRSKNMSRLLDKSTKLKTKTKNSKSTSKSETEDNIAKIFGALKDINCPASFPSPKEKDKDKEKEKPKKVSYHPQPTSLDEICELFASPDLCPSIQLKREIEKRMLGEKLQSEKNQKAAANLQEGNKQSPQPQAGTLNMTTSTTAHLVPPAPTGITHIISSTGSLTTSNNVAGAQTPNTTVVSPTPLNSSSSNQLSQQPPSVSNAALTNINNMVAGGAQNLVFISQQQQQQIQQAASAGMMHGRKNNSNLATVVAEQLKQQLMSPIGTIVSPSSILTSTGKPGSAAFLTQPSVGAAAILATLAGQRKAQQQQQQQAAGVTAKNLLNAVTSPGASSGQPTSSNTASSPGPITTPTPTTGPNPFASSGVGGNGANMVPPQAPSAAAAAAMAASNPMMLGTTPMVLMNSGRVKQNPAGAPSGNVNVVNLGNATGGLSFPGNFQYGTTRSANIDAIRNVLLTNMATQNIGGIGTGLNMNMMNPLSSGFNLFQYGNPAQNAAAQAAANAVFGMMQTQNAAVQAQAQAQAAAAQAQAAHSPRPVSPNTNINPNPNPNPNATSGNVQTTTGNGGHSTRSTTSKLLQQQQQQHQK